MTATKPTFIFHVIHVIFWIIFIGLCIKTGSILYSYVVSMAINPVASQNLNMGLNLSKLYSYDIAHYHIVTWMLIILTGLKAYIGYWVVKIFLEMKIEKPFSEGVERIITTISQIALWAGLLAVVAQAYCDWLMKKELDIPIDWASGEILFFAGVIYIIAQVFKKGIELQSENELTV